MTKKLLTQILPPEVRNIYVYVFLGIGIFISILSFNAPSLQKIQPPIVDSASLDTLIPKGYSLVPIKVKNSEALDSIIRQKAIVDLYHSVPGKRESTPIIRRGRLTRAPHNPNHFAILIPESWVKEILKYEDGFYVSIKGPEKLGTEFVKEKRRKQKNRWSYDAI